MTPLARVLSNFCRTLFSRWSFLYGPRADILPVRLSRLVNKIYLSSPCFKAVLLNTVKLVFFIEVA